MERAGPACVLACRFHAQRPQRVDAAPRPTQQRAGPLSGASGLLLWEAVVFLCAPGRRPERAPEACGGTPGRRAGAALVRGSLIRSERVSSSSSDMTISEDQLPSPSRSSPSRTNPSLAYTDCARWLASLTPARRDARRPRQRERRPRAALVRRSFRDPTNRFPVRWRTVSTDCERANTRRSRATKAAWTGQEILSLSPRLSGRLPSCPCGGGGVAMATHELNDARSIAAMLTAADRSFAAGDIDQAHAGYVRCFNLVRRWADDLTSDDPTSHGARRP
jgi:hypothetical protein